MAFKIENKYLSDFLPKSEPVSAPNNLEKLNISSINAGKIGENNLYGLLRKNILEKATAVSANNQTSFVSSNSKTTESNSIEPDNFFSFVKDKFESLKREFFDLFPRTPDPATDENLAMGNPSGAETDINRPDDYLLEKPQYSESYNRDRGTPNWTSWHLDSASLGSADRQNDFRPDDTLPADWYHVTPADYSGSGYDRGHMTPSGDRTSSMEDNSATFLMTNMIPQASKNNQQTWANLENYCRSLVKGGNELYIVSGGTGTKGYIADGKVAVPESTWKVILVQPEGTADVSRVTAETRVIAVDIPNDNSVNTDWTKYRVTTDSIEQETGYNFFSNVPENIQNVIEAKVDTQ